MRLQFQKNKATISFKTAGEPFHIHADRLHITSVIYNLLDNALKYGGSKPEIKVELAATPQEFKLRVEDNGIGISPEYANKVFEKFFRVPSGDHHNIKGYGLGSWVILLIKSFFMRVSLLCANRFLYRNKKLIEINATSNKESKICGAILRMRKLVGASKLA